MADIKESTAAGVQVNRPGVNPKDVVRKQEHDADMAARPTADAVASSIDVVAHDPVTVLNTPSVAMNLTGQQLSADVKLASEGALLTTDSGMLVDLGIGHTQAAYGDHDHANDHVAATGSATNTAATTVTGQDIAVDVRLDASGSLESNTNGVRVKDNTFAAKVHTHAVVGSTPGFMSTADKTRLDSLWSETTQSFENTSTVTWTIGSTAKANAHLGVGLKDVGNGIEVDFATVQAAGAIGGYSLTLTGAVLGSTANSTSYYVGADNGQTPDATILAHDILVPKSGTITRAFVKTRVGGVGSAEWVVSKLRVNDTTNTIIGSTPYNANPAEIDNHAMALAVTAGDRLAFLTTTPNWVTKPMNVQWWCQLWIQ